MATRIMKSGIGLQQQAWQVLATVVEKEFTQLQALITTQGIAGGHADLAIDTMLKHEDEKNQTEYTTNQVKRILARRAMVAAIKQHIANVLKAKIPHDDHIFHIVSCLEEHKLKTNAVKIAAQALVEYTDVPSRVAFILKTKQQQEISHAVIDILTPTETKTSPTSVVSTQQEAADQLIESIKTFIAADPLIESIKKYITDEFKAEVPPDEAIVHVLRCMTQHKINTDQVQIAAKALVEFNDAAARETFIAKVKHGDAHVTIDITKPT
jgi:hypothetical protein